WRADEGDDGQAPVVIEHQRDEAHDGQPFAQQIADRLRYGLLHLADVVRNPRHQLPRRLAREERRGLTEDVAEQTVTHVADYALTDVGHEIGGQIRADAFRQGSDYDLRAP